jgi:hypothetical protein
MRKLIIFFILFSPITLFSEHIFLKDGKILKGFIQNETDNYVTFKEESSGEVSKIARKKIIRVSYGDFEKEKVYVYKIDGSVFQGYQVDESKYAYTFRKELYNPAEFQIQKKKIKTISTEKVTKAGPKLPGALLRSSLIPGWGQYYSRNFGNLHWFRRAGCLYSRTGFGWKLYSSQTLRRS